MRQLILVVLIIALAGCSQQRVSKKNVSKENCLKCHGETKISKSVVHDKIKGGWLGKGAAGIRCK